MKTFFTNQIREKIRSSRVVATATIENVDDANPLAEALLAGGIESIEVTLRTPVALKAIQLLAQNFPEMLVVAGTLIYPSQVKAVQDAGASCAVAPGMNRKVIEAALEAEFPFAPGIATPSEIECALEYGCDILKFFPAEPLGGLSYLNNMRAPYSHLELKFIPLGGLSVENACDYLRESYILAVGGSWIANSKAIQDGDWSGIYHRAMKAKIL